MVLPIVPPLVIAAGFQGVAVGLPRRKGSGVAQPGLLGNYLDADAPHPGGRPGEIFVDQFLFDFG